MLTAPSRPRLLVPPAARAGAYRPPTPGPLVANLTGFNQLAGFPGDPRPPQFGGGWAADVRGTVDTAAGDLAPCAVFNGSSALGLGYGGGSPYNISGDIDFTLRFRFRHTSALTVGQDTNLLSCGKNDGDNLFQIQLICGSGPRTYIGMAARTDAGTLFNVTCYNYTGAGSETLDQGEWYSVVLRRLAATDTYHFTIVERPLFSAHANNFTVAGGLRAYDSTAGVGENLAVGGIYNHSTSAWVRPFTGELEGLYVWRGYYATDAEVATMGAGFDPLARFAAPALCLSKPQAHQTHQKTGTSATVELTGCLTGPAQSVTDIETNWKGAGWVARSATVDNTKRTFTCSFAIAQAAATPAGRQGDLGVRVSNAPSVAANVAGVGIGYVFAVGGQSNACGAYSAAQPYTPANGLTGGLYHPSYEIRSLADPTHNADSNWVDCSTESASVGSVWTRFAALWADRTGFPVMILAAARSGAVMGDNSLGTGQAGWAPTAALYRYSIFNLYDSLVRRINQLPGGAAVCLMMEGESDAGNGTTDTDFSTRLQAFAAALNTACGINTVISKLPSGLTGATAINSGIDLADTGSAAVQTGPDLTGTPYDASPHWTTTANAITIAAAWDARLAALGYAA